MKLLIEPVTTATLPASLELFAAYQRFYGADVDHKKNERFLRDLMKHPDWGAQFVALADGAPVGFATLYYTLSSVTAERIGLMNDLYVSTGWRGKGVGRAFIDHCAHAVRTKGFPRMIWLTEESNQEAQQLYDTYRAHKSRWIEYMLQV